jgi:hypothetical protein
VSGEIAEQDSEENDKSKNSVDKKKSTSFVRWEQPLVEGCKLPSAREGHSLTYMGHGKLLMFGGYTKMGETNNELWLFDMETQKWWSNPGRQGMILPGPDVVF